MTGSEPQVHNRPAPTLTSTTGASAPKAIAEGKKTSHFGLMYKYSLGTVTEGEVKRERHRGLQLHVRRAIII